MTTSLLTRPANIADAPAISALIKQLAVDLTLHPEGHGAELFFQSVSAQAEQQYLSDQRYVFTVVLDGEQIVALIAMRDRTHVFHLFVAKAYQQRGLAMQLWQTVVQQTALPSGCYYTVNAAIKSVGFYERLGFRRVADEVRMHGICFVPMTLLPESLQHRQQVEQTS